METLFDRICTPADAAAFVAECETALEESIAHAAHTVLEEDGCEIITISGPTCSGKTTTSDRLMQKIREAGHRAVLFSFDDFFRDRAGENVVDDSPPDYDSVHALDMEYLACTVESLLKHKSVKIPTYDFVSGTRSGYREYTPASADIFVFEGIQAVYPEVVSLFGKSYDSIFIHVDPPVSLGFTGPELRLFRRIVRDERCRGASPEFTLFVWQNVRANEEISIYPNMGNADILLNSFMPYEPYIIGRYLKPLLAQVPDISPYAPDAVRFWHMLSGFDNELFSPDMIPERSVFREFIG